jgi:pimeloyl-ACP methyl ester carboxylesterase
MLRTRIQLDLQTRHERNRPFSAGMRFHVLWLLIVCGPLLLTSCATFSLDTARRTASVLSWRGSKSIGTKAVKRKHQFGPVTRLFANPPKPSERTEQVLRQFVTHEDYIRDSDAAIRKLQTYAIQKPSLEKAHAVAELAFQQGEWAMRMGRQERAVEMFTTAILSSHQFLFDPNLDLTRNAYDPQFRSVADIYNKSLEELLRILAKRDELRPGKSIELKSLDRSIEFEIAIPGRWKSEAIEKFVFAGDYEALGLANEYRTYGLGVPLIGIRERSTEPELEKHYPPGLTMSFTAFLDIEGTANLIPGPDDTVQAKAKLLLLDPLEQNTVNLGYRSVPLESDITTPMAYYLDEPLLQTNVLATFALLNADFAKQYQGIYMLEPFDPNKIPVVMVHGLWSSPVTWLQMFNDLRADKDIRDNYQFWFCLYPTGQPFWESARQVREDLAQLDSELSAQHPGYQRGEMVLVGHSMGGLVSRMLTVHSRNELWNLISDHPIESFEGDPVVLKRIKSTFFFEPVPGISRVISIGTPYRGSSFATDTLQWLGDKLITLPQVVANDYSRIVSQNKPLLKNEDPLLVANSIDSLSPKNPLFGFLLNAEAGPGVEYHNIVGNQTKRSLVQRLSGTESGDGVVSLESAKIPFAKSEIEVDEDHTLIHQNPHAIFEVKRILLADLEARIRKNTSTARAPQLLQPMIK